MSPEADCLEYKLGRVMSKPEGQRLSFLQILVTSSHDVTSVLHLHRRNRNVLLPCEREAI